MGHRLFKAVLSLIRDLQYIIMNLGMSTNFGKVDLEHLPFPVQMKVDWIRVYQDPDQINYGCDPSDFPTQAYINQCVDRGPPVYHIS